MRYKDDPYKDAAIVKKRDLHLDFTLWLLFDYNPARHFIFPLYRKDIEETQRDNGLEHDPKPAADGDYLN